MFIRFKKLKSTYSLMYLFKLSSNGKISNVFTISIVELYEY